MKTISFTWTRVLAAGALMAACTSSPAPRFNQSASTPRPPASMPMESSKALGLWKSNFGAVKLEQNDSGSEGAVMGVWVYDRSGQEVIGFFAGQLRGNVLEFTWHEPAEPSDLTGAGYLTFEPQGSRFSGRWWSHDRSRGGLWSGWRQDGADAGAGVTEPMPNGGAYGGNTYGGATYGGAAVPMDPTSDAGAPASPY